MTKIVAGGIVVVGIAVVSLVLAGAKQETSVTAAGCVGGCPGRETAGFRVFAAGEYQGSHYQADERVRREERVGRAATSR